MSEALLEALQALDAALPVPVDVGDGRVGTMVIERDTLVTDAMNAAGAEAKGLHGAGVFAHSVTEQEAVYRAMAAVAPVELYGPNERRIDALMAERECAREIIADKNARIAALEAENAELYADAALLLARNQLLTAKLATFTAANVAPPDPKVFPARALFGNRDDRRRIGQA